MKRILTSTLIYLSVIALSLFALEVASSLAYRSGVFKLASGAPEQMAIPDMDAAAMRDSARFAQGGYQRAADWYRYLPFQMYEHNAFESETFNVGPDGGRSHDRCPGAPAAGGAEPFVIWVFGSSTVVAPEVDDCSTFPAQLQALLNAGSDRPFVVRNFGIIGSTFPQDMLAFFRKLLNADGRVDLAVFLNGWNDTSRQSFDEIYFSKFDANFEAGLERATDTRKSAFLYSLRRTFFWATTSFAQRVKAYMDFHANLDAEDLAERYMDEAARAVDGYTGMMTNLRRLVGLGVDAISAVARERGTRVLFMQIPALHATDKTRTPFEESVFQYRLYGFQVAPEDLATDQGRARAAEQLTEDGLPITAALFHDLYRGNNAALAEAARRNGAGYIDLTAAFEAHGDTGLFISLAHHQPAGLTVTAEAVARHVRALPGAGD